MVMLLIGRPTGQKKLDASPTATSMRLRGSHRATPVCLIPSGNRSSLSFPKISTYHPIYFPLSSDATGARQRMLGARRRCDRAWPTAPRDQAPGCRALHSQGCGWGTREQGVASCMGEQRELHAGRHWSSVGEASRRRWSFVQCRRGELRPHELLGGSATFLRRRATPQARGG
jgi:hypothetical protein